MSKQIMRTTIIPVFVLLLIPYNLSAQTWEWSSGDVNPLTAAFYERLPIIVVGKVTGVRTAEGVNVRKFDGTSGAKIYTIRVEQVLKGSRIIPSEELQVLIVPHVTVYGPPDPLFQQAEKLPDLPRQIESYPDIPLEQRRIFALFQANFNDPTGSVIWEGVKELSSWGPLYGYSFSYQVSKNGQEVEVVKRYMQITSIKDQDEQIRQLAQYSLQLLRDRESSDLVALGAIRNLLGFNSNWAWGRVTQRLGNGQIIIGPASRLTAEYLSDPEMDELVQITTDRNRSGEVRSWLVTLFKDLNEYANRPINPGPFLRLLQDRSDDPDVRWKAIYLLEQLDGPEVRTVFREMLLEEPTTDSERMIWNRLKDFPILKAPQ
jgi:hypothetical protein